MAIPRIPWSFPALCCLLLSVPIPISMGLECGEHQYRFHEKCCSDCPPGQRMRRRCTAGADTACAPCQDGHFSPRYHHGFCRSCTVCQARRGSAELKPCERSSDRVCACRAGFQPTGNSRGTECSPCPEGTFSRGRNQDCQPWTNCSFFGKNTLRAGTGTEDALCSLDPIPMEFPVSRDPIPKEFPVSRDPIPKEFPAPRDPFPKEFPAAGDPIPKEFPVSSSTPREVPEPCGDPGSASEPSRGSLSLLLLCLLLLLVSGISILLLIFQASQKKSRNGPGRSLQHKAGSCRVPIQEEHLDANSSLTKN